MKSHKNSDDQENKNATNNKSDRSKNSNFKTNYSTNKNQSPITSNKTQTNLLDKSPKVNFNDKSPKPKNADKINNKKVSELSQSPLINKNNASSVNLSVKKNNVITNSKVKNNVSIESTNTITNNNKINNKKNNTIVAKGKVGYSNYSTSPYKKAVGKIKEVQNDEERDDKIENEIENYNNQASPDKNVLLTSSHEHLRNHSRHLSEIQNNLEQVEFDQKNFSTIMNMDKKCNFLTDSTLRKSFEENEASESLQDNLDNTELIEENGNVQNLFEDAQHNFESPEKFFLENNRGSEQVNIKEISILVEETKDYLDESYNEEANKEFEQNYNIIDLTDKANFLSNVSNKSDTIKKNIFTLEKNDEDYENYKTDYKSVLKAITKQNKQKKETIKNDLEITKKLKDNNYCNEKASLLDSINSKKDSINKLHTKNNYNNLINKSLSYIREDTKELRLDSDVFSNGANGSLANVNKAETQINIFNNLNNNKENEKFSEISEKQVIQNFSEVEISNILHETENTGNNVEFSKMITYEKCIELLNRNPTRFSSDKDLEFGTNISNLNINNYITTKSELQQKEESNVNNIINIEMNKVNSENNTNSNNLIINQKIQEKEKDSYLILNIREADIKQLAELTNKESSDKNHNSEYDNFNPLYTDRKSDLDKFKITENLKKNYLQDKKETEREKDLSEEIKYIENKEVKNHEKPVKKETNFYHIDRSITLQINNDDLKEFVNDAETRLIEVEDFNNIKNIYMNEDNNYLKKQNNNLSLEPISKTLLNAERLTDQNLSNLGKQKLENFFEFFMQTISIIYFIYFIIVIYKTQTLFDPFIMISLIFSIGNIIFRFRIIDIDSKIFEINLEIINIFLLIIIMIIANTVSMIETSIYQILHSTSFFNFFSLVLFSAYIFKIGYLYKYPRNVSNPLLLEKLL